ncbi:hypothetical protein GAY33_21955 [Azospirillum brasilense]|uniref:hypothetical protein n=1 Tax=Azospirillum argentinense TaxID=2970906 RepID=UPI00190F0630|nr:hypothetical protein [Azospirillum argentinense]MBK3801841.1 hypothetical protein [Azospirillum argentinense]
MTTRIPLLSTGGLDLLSIAFPLTMSLATVGLYLAIRQPLVLTLCPWLIALSLAWAAHRSALKIGCSQLSTLVLGVIGFPLGLSVGSTLSSVFGPTHGPVPPDFVLVMGFLSIKVFLTVGMVMDFWWCEDWVPRAVARRRSAWGILLLAGAFITLSVAAPIARLSTV